MAIRKDVTFKGIEVPSAYIRVSGVTISPGNQTIKFGVNLMVDEESDYFDSHKEECAYNLDGDNPVCQAYQHLKSMEKYIGAEDC